MGQERYKEAKSPVMISIRSAKKLASPVKDSSGIVFGFGVDAIMTGLFRSRNEEDNKEKQTRMGNFARLF